MSAVMYKAGVSLLVNQSLTLQTLKGAVCVIGMGDFWNDDCDVKKAYESLEDDGCPRILLSHNPDSKKLLKNADWDVMLCGHTHGGQLIIPYTDLRPFLPIRDKKYSEGLFEWDGRYLHVTRGVGNLHGMRFNCPPEISILEVA